MADVNNSLGNYKRSKRYIGQLLKLRKGLGKVPADVDEARIDRIILDQAKGVENWPLVEKYSQRVVRHSDSIATLNKKFLQLIISAQPYYDKALNNVETRLAKSEKDRSDGLTKQLSLIRWLRTVSGLSVLVILSIIVIIYVFKKKQDDFKKERNAIKEIIKGKEQRLVELEEGDSSTKKGP